MLCFIKRVDVKCHPVTNLCPELDYNSNANLMLYDWIRDEYSIPEAVDDLNFRVMAIDCVKGIWRVFSSVDLDYYGRKSDKEVCDIVFLGNDKKFINEKPKIYLNNYGSPWEPLIQFNNVLKQTFSLDDNDSIEWLYKE